MPRWWRRRRRSKKTEIDEGGPKVRPPLREFVYLDDVSLRSLLASQTGELTEQVTNLLSQADEAELAGVIGASSPVVKAETSSRIQHTTTTEKQYSRKAVVQSLFKELRELDWIDVALSPQAGSIGVESVPALLASDAVLATDHLRRGALVEFEVELIADPIFRFSTIASELAEMIQDFPEMIDEPGARESLAVVVPGNRLLKRFLVGLVPLRAEVLSHRVIEVDGVEYVVPAADAQSIGVESRPLTIVGVTEQASYWRDVRRVLFSRSRFTMLCRVARDGLWSSWEPIKLADVLKEVVPTFPDLLADVPRMGLRAQHSTPTAPAVVPVLESFLDDVEASEVPGLTPEGATAARQVVTGRAAQLPNTVTGQNEAFRLVIQALTDHGCNLSGEAWLEFQTVARRRAGLTLFDPGQGVEVPSSDERQASESEDRLLDTEIIAIYW